jgi:SAM-dependent methyltransferase
MKASAMAERPSIQISTLKDSPTPESLEAIEAAKRVVRPADERTRKRRPRRSGRPRGYCGYVEAHTDRLATDLDLVRKHAKPGSAIVEVGSTPPLLTTAMVDAGYLVTGVDLKPSRFAQTIADLGLDIRECDVEKQPLPFGDDTFDLAVFNEIFEHLRINLPFTLREVLRVLTPGGVLLLSTPNLRSLLGLFNYLVRGRAYSCRGDIFRQYEKLQTVGHMGHVREYTVVEVREFLQRVGFNVEETIFRGDYEQTFYRAAKSDPRFRPYAKAATVTARIAVYALPKLRPFMSVVAKKPN